MLLNLVAKRFDGSGCSAQPPLFPNHRKRLTPDLFEPVQVNGVAGYIFAQPGMTVLYWIADWIQFSVVGPITEAEAMKVAESLVA